MGDVTGHYELPCIHGLSGIVNGIPRVICPGVPRLKKGDVARVRGEEAPTPVNVSPAEVLIFVVQVRNWL